MLFCQFVLAMFRRLFDVFRNKVERPPLDFAWPLFSGIRGMPEISPLKSTNNISTWGPSKAIVDFLQPFTSDGSWPKPKPDAKGNDNWNRCHIIRYLLKAS